MMVPLTCPVTTSSKRALDKGCIFTLQWSLPESGNFLQLCFTTNQERDS